MKKREKEYVEFRYYEIPQRVPLIALMGERWVTRYGSDPMHFHNYMEIGYCCYGEGVMHLGKEDVKYGEGTVTVIPKNFPHHTTGRDEVFDSWEYLFIDRIRGKTCVCKYGAGAASQPYVSDQQGRGTGDRGACPCHSE